MLSVMPQGMRPALFEAANAFSASGRIPPQDRIRTTRKRFWHRVNCPTGSTAINFFDAARSKWITNFNSGQLQNNQFFFINAIKINALTNITFATGAVLAAAAGEQSQTHATNDIPTKVLQEVLTMFSTGLFTLTVNGQVIADAYGLDAFPAGGGIAANVGFATTEAATGHAAAIVSNGVPDARNVNTIPRYPVTPGIDVKASIEWQSGHSITNSLVFMVSLDGTLMEWITG